MLTAFLFPFFNVGKGSSIMGFVAVWMYFALTRSWLNTKHHLSQNSCSHTLPSVFLGTLQKHLVFTPLSACNVRSLLICCSLLFLFHRSTALAECWSLWWILYSCLTYCWLLCQNFILQVCKYMHRFSPCKILLVTAASSVRQHEMS